MLLSPFPPLALGLGLPVTLPLVPALGRPTLAAVPRPTPPAAPCPPPPCSSTLALHAAILAASAPADARPTDTGVWGRPDVDADVDAETDAGRRWPIARPTLVEPEPGVAGPGLRGESRPLSPLARSTPLASDDAREWPAVKRGIRERFGVELAVPFMLLGLLPPAPGVRGVPGVVRGLLGVVGVLGGGERTAIGVRRGGVVTRKGGLGLSCFCGEPLAVGMEDVKSGAGVEDAEMRAASASFKACSALAAGESGRWTHLTSPLGSRRHGRGGRPR